MFLKPKVRISDGTSALSNINIRRSKAWQGRKWRERIQRISCFQTAHKFAVEFCQNTTIHGVRYFAERSRHWTERLWWVVAFLLSLWLCGSSILGIWMKWNDDPMTVSYESSKSIKDIPFPTVTICPQTKAMKDKIDLISIYQSKGQNLSDEERINLQALSHICSSFPETMMDGLKDEFAKSSIYNVISNIGLSLDSTFKQCHWKGEHVTCSKIFVPVYTDDGLCFSFNALNARDFYTGEMVDEMKTVKDRPNVSNWSLEDGYDGKMKNDEYPERTFRVGDESGLIVYLNIFQDDLEYICHVTGFGFKVTLSVPGEPADASSFKFEVPILESSRIVVTPSITITSEKLRKYGPEKRGCYYNSERQLRYFKTYTQNNCEEECFANLTAHFCECVKFSTPRDKETKICGTTKKVCYLTIAEQFEMDDVDDNIAEEFHDNCNCLPACTSLDYDGHINHIKYDLDVIRKTAGADSNDRPSRLAIYYRSLEIGTMKRVEKYNFTNFMSNCGGLLGLFLGVSLLSMVEFLYFFTLRLFWTIRRSTSENAVTPFNETQ